LEVPIENWVKLKPGVRKLLRFDDHRLVEREITDPIFGFTKFVRSLVFHVIWEDGMKVDKMFSVVSERLAAQLAPYLEGGRYREYEFVLLTPPPKIAAPRLVEVRKIR